METTTKPDKAIDHNQVFEQELARLNPRQREAVEAIEGPVMVIAGPGTGKTQILAARIGNILRETDTRPENILCLTYTDAGAIAMRKRLIKFIGSDAYKVEIATFHAFCNKVIKENLDAFGIRALDSITELEQIELFRQLVDNIDVKSPLKRFGADPYYDIPRLKKLFQLMKTEDMSPEFICKKADEYIADLPLRDEYQYKRANATKGIKVGDLKQDAIDREVRKMEELKAAANLYPVYQKMMHDRKRYDFDDMILLVKEKFQTDPDLLLNYQERFQYFLVDEYQDTNGAQNEILRMLISFWPIPNVFVVGDDDQSIFRFQGANVENILSFNEAYGDHLHIIVLEDNYRSSQHILDVSKQLISVNQERLINAIAGLSKDLKANHGDFAHSLVKPQVREYYNQAHETVGVAKEIERLYRDGVNMDEVAVIYRNHRQAEDVVRYLEAKGVPLNIKRRADILQSPFIGSLLMVMEYIEGESRSPFSREDLLFEMLHLNFFGIDPLVIARLAIELRSKTGESQRTTWREELRKSSKRMDNSLFADKTANDNYKAMQRLSDNIEYWVAELHNTTLQVLVEKIITRGGILKYVMDAPHKFSLMQELYTFFEFIKEESVKNPKISLNDFLRSIAMMKDENIAMPLGKMVYASPGINFVTAHGSKGLEYEYVYLIGATADQWDKKSTSGTFSFPDNIVTKLGGDEVEESRRLFYVALTRAKHQLVVSYPAAKDNKELEKSRFVTEIADSENLETQQVKLPDEELLDYTMNLLKEEEPPVVKLLEQSYLKKILENYSLSVTHLNTYLKCPISFYFGNLLRVPVAKNQYMAFGSAVHYALELLFRKMTKTEKDQFPPVGEMVADFEWYMFRHQDSFTPEEFKRRLDYGREILPAYYNKYVQQWNKVVTVERNFRNVINGVPINGKLDKLEFDGNDVNVVDYKTGKFDNAKKRFGAPTEDTSKPVEELTHEEHYGGDYWRQAVFYKILVDNEPSKDWNVVSTEFDFIEPDPKTKEYHKQKVVIGVKDMATVVDQITDTYHNIMALKFDQGCNEKDCKWCNFVKNQYQDAVAPDEYAEPE